MYKCWININGTSKSYFPNVSNDIYEKEITENSYYLNDKNITNKPKLFYSNGIQGVLYLILDYCVEGNNPNCKSMEEIKEFINLTGNDLTILLILTDFFLLIIINLFNFYSKIY